MLQHERNAPMAVTTLADRKTIHKVAIARTVAFSALALVTMTGPTAQAGPIVPPGRYCLSYDEGGTDCSFTSYAQRRVLR